MIIHLQAKAKADLKEIYEYTYEKWGMSQADKYLDVLDDGIQGIANHPKIGKDVSAIRLGYRKLRIEQHIVFYKINKQKIQIFRILHENMDAKRHV